jgi:hypothetical protein
MSSAALSIDGNDGSVPHAVAGNRSPTFVAVAAFSRSYLNGDGLNALCWDEGVFDQETTHQGAFLK